MLQIRLIKGPSSEGGSGAKPSLAENVTVACPDHLVLADLPVAKGIGGATAASLVKSVGRRSRRQLGERVHFCVRCDFPIAIYGRLSPCEHAFCLDCARSDSTCYLCDERIQKIQTIKIMEGIFICAAPHCLKSFLKRSEFESHIHESHADLLQPNAEKEDGNESEAQSITQPTVSDSTARAPPRPVLSPGANSQLYDREDKTRRQQNREQLGPRPIMQQPMPPQMYGILPSDPHNRFQQQSFDAQGTPQQEPGQFSDKQPDTPFPDYPPMHSIQQPNFAMPVPPFGFPPFPTEGAQPFYGGPYEMARQDSAPEIGSEQGSVLGFPPGPGTAVNYPSPYPQPWNTGPAGIPFEAPPGGMGTPDRFANPDSHGKVGYYQGGDYGRNSGAMPLNPLPPMGNKAMDAVEPPRDGKGVLAPQPMQLPPPPPSQAQRGQFYSGDMGPDGQQGYGWQHENHGSFGNSQD